MKRLNGIKNIFVFTFKHQTTSKGYLSVTIIVGLLLFLLPFLVMMLIESSGDASVRRNTVKTVYIVDNAGINYDNYDILNSLGKKGYTDISYIPCSDFEQAKSNSKENSVILAVDKNENALSLNLLLTDSSGLTESDAAGIRSFLEENFQLILFEKSGMTKHQIAEYLKPVTADLITDSAEQSGADSSLDSIKEIFSFILPFAVMLLLYFMVIFYGQSVANSLVMEKSSKLMDTFLVSVKPTAIVFGKMFAIVASSILQIAVWIAAVAGGFASGTAVVKYMNPDSNMALVRFFDSMGEFGGVFSVPGCILAVLIIICGFILYCSLASIGGSAAGKPEDISSTNILFTVILVISFLATIYGDSASAWLDYIPFTSVLVTPGRLILGEISAVSGIISLMILLAVSVLFVLLAGKIYKMMSLYKGNPPTPSKLLKMLRK